MKVARKVLPLDYAIGFPNTYPMDSAFHLLNNPAPGLKKGVGKGQWRTGWYIRHPLLKPPESARPGVHHRKSHKYYADKIYLRRNVCWILDILENYVVFEQFV